MAFLNFFDIAEGVDRANPEEGAMSASVLFSLFILPLGIILLAVVLAVWSGKRQP